MTKQYNVKDYWSKVAPVYFQRGETLRFSINPLGAKEYENFFVSQIRKLSPKKVLEVGCGYGLRAKQLVGKLRGLKEYFGVEISPQMVDLNKKFVKNSKIKEIVCLDASMGLPYEDGFFDLVFTVGVLMHNRKENAFKILQEMTRVSGGLICSFEDKQISSAAEDHDYYSLYKKAGLKVLDYQTAPQIISPMKEIFILGKK